jgi:integrase
MAEGAAPAPTPPGCVPRVARLLALAHRLEGLVRTGSVRDYAALARLGYVTRARVSQIVSLLNLAPDLQEAVLFLPPTVRGRDPLILRDLLALAAAYDWRKQRKMWRRLGEGCFDRSGSADRPGAS